MNRFSVVVSMLVVASLCVLTTRLAFASEAPATTNDDPDERRLLGFVADAGVGGTTAFGLLHPTLHLGGSLVIDRSLFVGVFWQGTLGEQYPADEVDDRLYYDLQMLGGRVSYFWFRDWTTPLGLSLAGGWGEVSADFREAAVGEEATTDAFGEDNFFWIEPTLAADLRLFEYAHARLEAGYRFAGGVDYRAASNANTSGVFVRLSIVGGLF
jgi:hypothetical protein